MTTPKPFSSALEASSNQTPGGGELYAPLRKNVVETALAMGYDKATMIEISVSWGDDQDPFGHVKNAAYGQFVTACNVRVFHSFEAQLKDRFDDFMNARHIGCLVSTITTKLMRPVKFPDSLIVAHHLKELLPDRYFGVNTIWSLRQQAIVAEISGWVVFFDHDKGKLANLQEVGGVWTDLYHALLKRKNREVEIAAKWEKDHPKKQKAKM